MVEQAGDKVVDRDRRPVVRRLEGSDATRQALPGQARDHVDLGHEVAFAQEVVDRGKRPRLTVVNRGTGSHDLARRVDDTPIVRDRCQAQGKRVRAEPQQIMPLRPARNDNAAPRTRQTSG